MDSDEMNACDACETPLTGGTDTFGDVAVPLCLSCWMGLVDARRDSSRIYQPAERAEQERRKRKAKHAEAREAVQ